MNYLVQQTPTESKRHAYFSNLKNSKRVRWSESRHYTI